MLSSATFSCTLLLPMFQFSSFFMLKQKKILFFLSTSRSFFFASLICMIHEYKCVPLVDKDVIGWREKKKKRKACYLCVRVFSFQQFFLLFLLLHVVRIFFRHLQAKKKNWEWKSDMVRLKIDVIFNIFFACYTFLEKRT